MLIVLNATFSCYYLVILLKKRGGMADGGRRVFFFFFFPIAARIEVFLISKDSFQNSEEVNHYLYSISIRCSSAICES